MSEVRFSDAAQSDLLDIVVFIARDNPRAAEDWLAAIEAELERRLADSVANPDAVRPWADVEAEALAPLGSISIGSKAGFTGSS